MNTVIDQYDPFIVFADVGKIVIPVTGNHYQVQRVSGIGHTHSEHFNFSGSCIQFLPPVDDFGVGGGLGAFRLFKPGGDGLGLGQQGQQKGCEQ